MKIFILDTETNGLVPDKIWCVVLKELKENRYYGFINDSHFNNCAWASLVEPTSRATFAPLSKFLEWIKGEINACDAPDNFRCVTHNGLDYDYYWINALLNLDLFSLGISHRDSYVLSRLASPKRTGGHSVESWGKRFNLEKEFISDDQWSKFDPIMVKRCIKDVEIQEKIYDYLRNVELRGFSLKSIELEHDVQRMISEQRRNGIYVDEAKVLSLYSTCKRRADKYELELQSVFPPRAKLIREYNPKETKDGSWSKRTCGIGMDPSSIGGPYSSIYFEPFNPSSPLQRVTRLLELGWKPNEFTKPSKTHPNGQPKFTEESLESLPDDAPKAIKILGTYLMTRSRQRSSEAILRP